MRAQSRSNSEWSVRGDGLMAIADCLGKVRCAIMI